MKLLGIGFTGKRPKPRPRATTQNAAKAPVRGGREDLDARRKAASAHQTEEHCPPRLRLEQWALDRLIPSPRNARTHSAAQVAEIAGSIRAFGFTNPILAGEDGDVIAGHGRLAAARLLGLLEVPVIPLGGLTDVQRRQLVLADNRIALNAGWDFEMLNLELKELSLLGADLAALGVRTLTSVMRPAL